MTEELKPCPFCGGNGSYSNAGFGFIVKCRKCGSKTSIQESGKEAAEAWNSRSIENELSEKITKLEKENELLRFTLEDIARGYDYSDGCNYTREEMIRAAEKTLKEANK